MNRQLLSFSCAFLFLAAGCSKKAEDPPRVRSGIVLNIFHALERGDDEEALNGIRKLGQIDSRNSFLPQFEAVERANIMIKRAEKKIAEGKRKEAEKIIMEAAESQGNSVYLAHAKRMIADLSRMEVLLPVLENPASANELEKAAKEFIVLSKRLGKKGVFLEYPQQRLRDVAAMRKREARIIGIDLLLEYADQIRDSIAPSIQAQLYLFNEQNLNQ